MWELCGNFLETKMPLGYLQGHFLRCLAELNCSNWFCRPVPNLPAQAPWEYKGRDSFWISKDFLLFFVIEALEGGFPGSAIGADGDAGEAAGHLRAQEFGVHACNFPSV